MKLLKRILKNEAGQALAMSLIMLVLGGLLVVPTLSFMTTNLTANRQIDRKNLELYAADAGVEEVLWNVQYNQDGFPLPEDGKSLPDPPMEFTLNERTVVAEISKEADQPYKITSTATGADGHSTMVKCYIDTEADLSWLFEHAITSGGSVTTTSSDIIYGGILYKDTFDGNADVRSGEVRQGTVNLPTEAMLSAFYWADVDGHLYSGSSITVSGSQAIPTLIGPLYTNGDLSITGSGYGKLSGTVYVKGKFSVDDKCTIDLNGHTIYATYYTAPCPDNHNKENCAVYFKPGCTVYGPGCIIGVGNVNFQPNLGMGAMLLGADDVDGCNPDSPNRFLLSRFKAIATGKLTSFQVKCSGEGNIKVALYADSGGQTPTPTTLLGAVDTADNLAVMAGWNPITFPETQINSGTYYWLAAISDSAVICKKPLSSTNKYKTDLFTGFTFPKPTAPPADQFTSQTTEQYMLQGYTGSQEFIFLMSVNCKTNLQPGSSFYGSIAGDANVELKNHCTLNLVGLPEDGLDFPGMDTGEGETTGTPATIRTYTIK